MSHVDVQAEIERIDTNNVLKKLLLLKRHIWYILGIHSCNFRGFPCVFLLLIYQTEFARCPFFWVVQNQPKRG